MVGMKKLFIQLIFVLATSAVMSDAQTTAPVAGDSRGPAIVKLNNAEYPKIAQAARVSGDVHVKVILDKNGLVLSTTALDGPAMLREHSAQYAHDATYTCASCSEDRNELQLTFHYSISDRGKTIEELCKRIPQSASSDIIQIANNQISFSALPWICCDPSTETASIGRVRGIKCAYLWKCQVKTLFN